jgi:hypothetical protein
MEFDQLEAEMKAIEAAGVEKASQLSFTKKQMTDHLEGPHATAILKGHLYLEHVLIVGIRDALEHPDEINVRHQLPSQTQSRHCTRSVTQRPKGGRRDTERNSQQARPPS